jgi:hypothetical protein
VLCTSRDLPLMLQQELGSSCCRTHAGEIRTLRKGPTPPRPALAEGFSTWRLISQLQMNYLSLMDSEEGKGRRRFASCWAVRQPGGSPWRVRWRAFATACWSRFTAACLNPARSFSPAAWHLPDGG